MATATPPPASPELPDMYTPSAMLLSLLAVGYYIAAVNRVAAVTDNASLYALLGEAPETVANHLLLGQLAYASPLGPGLAAVFATDDSARALRS